MLGHSVKTQPGALLTSHSCLKRENPTDVLKWAAESNTALTLKEQLTLTDFYSVMATHIKRGDVLNEWILSFILNTICV